MDHLYSALSRDLLRDVSYYRRCQMSLRMNKLFQSSIHPSIHPSFHPSIHLSIYKIYMTLLQGNYPEALQAQARAKIKVLRFYHQLANLRTVSRANSGGPSYTRRTS